MELHELLLHEFDDEMKKTRATLDRVPEGKGDYKPHEKSMALGKLAAHLAQLPSFAGYVADLPELDFATAAIKPLAMESRQQMLDAFDGYVAEARPAISRCDAARLQQPWKLRAGDHVILQGTRYEMLRSLLFNHIIHHRAQLGVYLRLNGVPVPSIYGPSADVS